MILHPTSAQELSSLLKEAASLKQKVQEVKLDALNRMLEYTPEDMTATVEAGMTLQAFQSQLRKHGQWLAIDPPHPENTTIAKLLTHNLSGPRRFGNGTIRELLLGIRVALADGRLIKAGGKVVKNVAGYDLCKLFVGSQGSLGVIVEATFKLKPLPESEQLVSVQFESLDEVDRFLKQVLQSDLTPVVLDVHNLDEDATASSRYTVIVGFAGALEDVQLQVNKARELGARPPYSFDYDTHFWSTFSADQLSHASLLPSKLTRFLHDLGHEVPFVARAGNGFVWYRGGRKIHPTGLPTVLFQKIKDAYDPQRILCDLSL
jgi:FAD/FMN-containing dehydrogenase